MKKVVKAATVGFGVAFLSACGESGPPLPEHEVDKSSLAPKDGMRVQIDVKDDITEKQCSALIDKYRDGASPDGQVSVHKPSDKLGGNIVPYCIENFDGKGVSFNNILFE